MKIDKNNVISMMDFLINYVRVENVDEILTQINHYDITDLNIDGIKRVPNDLVTEDDIRTGRILMVESSGFKHRGKMICAYIRPNLIRKNKEEVSDLDKMIYDSLYKSDTPLFYNKTLTKRRY